MPNLIVVNDPRDWPLAIEGVEIVPARDYLTDSRFADLRGAKVFNLCRSYRYQSVGYYVSLLAEARGHKPVPSVTTVQDLKTPAVIRIASEDLDEDIQRSLGPIRSREFVLSIYFGHNVAKRHERLSRHLFRFFSAPFLRAVFVCNEKDRHWHLQNINPISASDIPEEHRPFVVEVAREYFDRKRSAAPRRIPVRYDLAILYDPAEKEAPSNARALQRFMKAAESLGLSSELVEKEDYGRLAEFDALFIRETTSVNHHTYRFARRAQAEGLVVVDDPESILKCTNKVFLAELLHRHKVLVPRTLILHRETPMDVILGLGLPCILKRPDSSFSQGVVKAETEQGLRDRLRAFFERSDLVIAQEFLPTPFDWRIGVFDRQPLFACKYYMARSHWQIIRRNDRGEKIEDGTFETIPVEHVPKKVIKTALKAANLVGDGLYGVDLKETEKGVTVIEVNDNPNIDAGVEDMALKDELYERIMRVFLRRIEERKRGGWS